jgi:hypothetical protein
MYSADLQRLISEIEEPPLVVVVYTTCGNLYCNEVDVLCDEGTTYRG